jgi:type IV pilus assembly protein PilB
MTSPQLIELLKQSNLLQPPSLAKLSHESEISGRPAEELLHEWHLLDDDQIAQVKATALNIPFQKIDPAAITKEMLALIPEETAKTYGLVPLEKRGNLLIAGMLNPDDAKAQEALKFVAHKSGLDLGVYVVSYADWQKVLRKYAPYQSEVAKAVQALSLKNDAGMKAVELDAANVKAEDAPIVRIVADTLREAVDRGASDVHVEPSQNYLRVRFRIGGELEEAASLPEELAQPVISRLKVMSNLRIDETRVPQDGRFRAKILDREIDFRVATFPTPSGEKMAIRVLDPKTGLKSLDDLGLAGPNLEKVKRGIDRPYGMVLISGPTGSGKSTTLYAILQLLNNIKVNIVSLEDPVEYFVSGVNQSQVRPEINYDFASGLREILRQDPDVIMVGEIRDNETAGLAVHAALTGHVVLSTIHTNNAIGVIPRFIDMGVDAFLLPEALALMISQRLISKLCDACKKPSDAPEGIAEAVDTALATLPKELAAKWKKPYQIYHAEGCEVCHGRGSVGRIAVMEVFEMTKELGAILGKEPSLDMLAAEAKRQGMITMRADGVLKALEGTIAIEEVLRETNE